MILKMDASINGIFMQSSKDPNLIDKWCYSFLGRRFQDWYGYNVDDMKRVYAFKDEATLLVFKLTWGHKAWA